MAARKSSPSPASSNRRDIPFWDVLLVALYLTRFLVPAEGMEQGSTLWIATTWLGVATIRLWGMWRNGEGIRFRFHWVDGGVAALVAGYLLAAVLVLVSTGDRRAALNGLWEWLSVGVMWLLMREACNQPSVRKLFSWGVLVTGVSLASMGIWQHFVWYPQQAQELSLLLELHDRQQQGSRLSAADRAEFQRLQNQFGTEPLLMPENERALLLARTRDSNEAIGRFALANSFAALLLVVWFFALDFVRHGFQNRLHRIQQWPLLAALGIVSVSLLLTKSRTAMIGLLAALSWMAARTLLSGKISRRKLLMQSGIGLAAAATLVVVVTIAGGLDLEVLSEAPKSLTYRLEYWQATWAMIQDHPIFGVGPGNFRQHYFQYKLPGSSEEILDPHNLLLDAWSTGGLTALLGLLLLIGIWIVRLIRLSMASEPSSKQKSTEQTTSDLGKTTWRTGGLIGLVAFGIPLAEGWLLEGYFDQQLLGLGLAWLVLHSIFSTVAESREIRVSAILAAGTALLIHLLGAGGVGMPAILQLFLLLLILSTPVDTSPRMRNGKLPLVFTGICVLMTVGSLWTGLVPVVTSDRLLEQGRHQWLVTGQRTAAEALIRQAIQADSLASETHVELAGILHQQWEQTGRSDNDLFAEAVGELQSAIRNNPRAAKLYLILSQWWSQRHDHDAQRASSQAAVEAARQGVQLYPHYAPLRAQWAIALEADQQPRQAADIARSALDLDDLNRTRGHVDKLLPEKIREELEKISYQESEKR